MAVQLWVSGPLHVHSTFHVSRVMPVCSSPQVPRLPLGSSRVVLPTLCSCVLVAVVRVFSTWRTGRAKALMTGPGSRRILSWIRILLPNSIVSIPSNLVERRVPVIEEGVLSCQLHLPVGVIMLYDNHLVLVLLTHTPVLHSLPESCHYLVSAPLSFPILRKPTVHY